MRYPWQIFSAWTVVSVHVPKFPACSSGLPYKFETCQDILQIIQTNKICICFLECLINYYKRVVSNRIFFFSHSSESQKTISRCQQGHTLSIGSKENLFLFSSTVLWFQVFLGLWPYHSIPASIIPLPPLLPCLHPYVWVSKLPLLFYYKNTFHWI